MPVLALSGTGNGPEGIYLLAASSWDPVFFIRNALGNFPLMADQCCSSHFQVNWKDKEWHGKSTCSILRRK